MAALILTPALVAEITSRYTAGEGAEGLAQEIGMGSTRLFRVLRDAGVRLRTKSEWSQLQSARRRNHEREARIVAAYLEGDLSTSDVAATFGVTTRTVWRALARAGKSYSRQARPGQRTDRKARHDSPHLYPRAA